jgi:anti-sigma B factor antagonist
VDVEVEYPHDGAAVVRTVGRLNMVAAPALREAVERLVTAEGRTHVVLDLTGTTFVDSSGLGALIGGLKAARAAGGDLRIAAVPPAVLTVLQLTNLDRVLRPYGTVAEALA